MVRVTGEVVIDRPVETVFDVVADERSRYDPSVRGAELLTDGPLGVGTCFLVTSSSLGQQVEAIVEITGYERPARLASTTHLALMDIHSTLVFEPAGGGTRLRWACEVAPHGVLRVLAPVLAVTARRQMLRDWTALPHQLEAAERERVRVG